MVLSAITLSLQLQRTSFDLLDGLSIEVAARNSAHAPANVRFPAPAEFAIDVLRNGTVVWSSVPRATPATVPAHVRALNPGPTVLAVYIWNELAADGSSIAPGDYTVRVRLLSDQTPAKTETRVHFVAPLPVSALATLKRGDVVTIAGKLDAMKQQLTDGTGTIALARRLTTAPDGPVAVRGYLTTLSDRSQAFFIERWAPLEQ